MYGADPRLSTSGRRPGCRRLFAEEGVRHPLGLRGPAHLDEVRTRWCGARPAVDACSVIVKLNEGVSGQGNAMVDLRGLPAPGAAERARRDRASGCGAMQFERPDTPFRRRTWPSSPSAAASSRSSSPAIEIRSPSVQLRVTPSGEVELLSTHDQVLGGPSGQSYLGCRFPADFDYAQAISTEASIIGARLAREGVIGRFAIDFVVGARRRGRMDAVRDRAQPAQGRHDAPVPHAAVPHRRPLRRRTGLFLTRRAEKHLVATDHLESDQPPSADDRRPVRHRRATRPALRPGAAERGRVPHDQLRDRTRPGRPDRGRQHAGSKRRRSISAPSECFSTKLRQRSGTHRSPGRSQGAFRQRRPCSPHGGMVCPGSG